MYTRYEPKRMSLSGIPKLDGVVPASAYQLMRGFGVEAGTEDLGFMTIHYIRQDTAFENYGRFYRISIFITAVYFSLKMEKLSLIKGYFFSR